MQWAFVWAEVCACGLVRRNFGQRVIFDPFIAATPFVYSTKHEIY